MKNRTKKIFVGGVPTDMPEDSIRTYFQQFGEVGVAFAHDCQKMLLCVDRGGCLGNRQRHTASERLLLCALH